jgi:hypothetical protein
VAENLQFNLSVNNANALTSIDEFFNKFQQGAKQARAVLDNELGTKGKIQVLIEVKDSEAKKEFEKVKRSSRSQEKS